MRAGCCIDEFRDGAFGARMLRSRPEPSRSLPRFIWRVWAILPEITSNESPRAETDGFASI
jgi:hypothetical protein